MVAHILLLAEIMQGVGKFYDPMAAQKIFDDYPELEIFPVFFPPFFYCRKCLTYTTPKACPHDNDVKEQISGTCIKRNDSKWSGTIRIYSKTRSSTSNFGSSKTIC